MADPARALERWLAISRPVAKIAGRLETALGQRHGISLSGYEVLSLLASGRGWTPMVGICEAVELSQPRVSRLVAQLERDGALERQGVVMDGRAFQVRLTRKGRRMQAAAGETVSEILAVEAKAPDPVAAMLRQALAAE